MAVSPQHFTLTANVEKTFTFDVNGATVEVTNLDGAAEVYFTVNNTPAVVGQDGCHVLPAAICSMELPDETKGVNSVVRVRSAGTPKVSVRVW
ncbi:hypothetical protein [Micromonospora costi]|uniref:Uncharacterized protein n=1 Tax=Micromonospora costi TaxID=1530042 RepID=A0A3B0A607_9ACTN|nr:hypothetical protein [Micromonospora costi]RKN55942.1 hypothetical protein D7193_15260 [Micromonospora costi]